MDSAHDTAQQFSSLFSTYLGVVVVAVAVVYVAVGIALWRSRSTRGHKPSASHGHPIALGIYATLLTVVAILLIGATFSTEHGVDHVSPNPAARVDIVASQWRWTFTYPGHSRAPSVDRVVVPVGQVVEFRLRSVDVIHSIWFVSQRFKRYATPGDPTRFELTFDRRGLFRGECAQFCGIGHDQMRFVIDVISPAAYRGWLSRRGASAAA